MKNNRSIPYIIIVFILLLTGCSKEQDNNLLYELGLKKCILCNDNDGGKNYGVDLCLMLVNDKDQFCDSFRLGENFTFKFFLINNIDTTVRYKRLCHEFIKLLNLYQKDTLNEYALRYIGYPMPTLACPLVCIYDPIKPKTAINLGNVSTADTSRYKWPVMSRGSYCTGDSLRMTINDKQITFRKRIYFKIY